MKAAQPQPRYFDILQAGAALVIRFNTAALVAEETVENVGKQLLFLADKLGSGGLLLNFESVQGLGSAMLGKLITLHKRMTATGGRLALCRIHPYLYEKIFEIHRLSTLFTVYDDEQEALKAL